MVAYEERSRTLQSEFSDIINPGWRRYIAPVSVAVLGLAYLTYLFFFFDFVNIGKRWHADRAAIFSLDSYAHKIHIDTKWRDTSKLKATLEGSRWERYKTLPAWVTDSEAGTGSVIDFGEDGQVELQADRMIMRWADYAGPIIIHRPDDAGFRVESDGPLPTWLRISKSKVDVRPTLYSRVQVYKTKIIIHRYFTGWEYFFFDFKSPLRDFSFSDTMALVFSGDRMDPERSNASLVLHEFWTNSLWLHRDVFVALMQTIFMAVMGTLIAALAGLPLAFMAAYNVTPLSGIRFALRRLFDTLRGIDTLIWSLIFIRAFGMGPFSGILAIGITDTGTLGKLMSEAIENIDKKQVEGVQSTGANRVQQHRFGILPQILPLFISQVLYYLESNTRGAVIIGAMGAGGIGLQFLGALRTGTDWENVAYISLIVLITVILIDMMSSFFRRRLIG
ncbi:MAG: phosphonate ABC transporter, permease protein PhnE [Alphaproteobacteria bacterium]|nr:phosphonate ABC transporter, permease protein PhnE [Alphaproteobacteria bacterium]